MLRSADNIISIPDDNSTYTCGSSSATITSVQWLINGTQFEDLNLTNVGTDFNEFSRLGILLFSNLSVEYNNTNIQCRAVLNNGETLYSNNLTLLIQGEIVICELVVTMNRGLARLCHKRLATPTHSFNARPIP